MKTEKSMLANGRTGDGQVVNAPSGPALFAFAGNSAWIYFPRVRQLARWHDGQLVSGDFAVTGEVLSLRVREGGNLEFAVRRNAGTLVVNAQNQVDESIPANAGPVMLLTDGFLYSTSDEIILRRPDASVVRFPIEGAESFLKMGEGYVQVRAGRISYVIPTTRGRERMFQLPEPAP